MGRDDTTRARGADAIEALRPAAALVIRARRCTVVGSYRCDVCAASALRRKLASLLPGIARGCRAALGSRAPHHLLEEMRKKALKELATLTKRSPEGRACRA